MRYSLNAVAEREGLPGKNDEVLRAFASAYGVDPKTGLYRLPGRAVEAYGVRDVQLPLQLARRFDRQIEEHGLEKIWRLESDVLPVLVKMRRRGVRVSVERIMKIIEWATKKIEERLKAIYSECGATIRIDQIWKADAIASVLRRARISIPTSATGKVSIKNAWLEKSAGQIGKHFARARTYGRLLTFAYQTLEYQVRGRIHGVFHQLRNTKETGNDNEEDKGGRFGRFSGEHPNLQQQPVRDDEFGEMWRSVYIPEPGCFWVCSDWSQQEPRIAVHYAELLHLPGAAEFAERYRNDPTLDCHQMLADLTGIARKIVKNYFNGSIYGMGDAKLCRAIGHPTTMINKHGKIIEVPGPEGKKIIDKFRGDLPWVSLLTREAADRAKKKGVVWTAGGRRCNFPKDDHGNYDWVHKAFSRIGQGSAADQMKMTLVAADRAGIPIQLAVHDEFDYSETNPKRAKQLKELQMETLKFNVPMLVDLEVGPSWGELQKLTTGEAVVDAFRKLSEKEAA
jgi:DNA polymerase I-like protein with 3'-5' exonuclease and polymerase domains